MASQTFIDLAVESCTPEQLASTLDGAYSAVNSLIDAYFKLAEILIEELGDAQADSIFRNEVDELINADARQALATRISFDLGVLPETLLSGGQ